MRPVGEIREALERAMRQQGPGTSKAIAAAACVGYEAARRTLDNMVRAEHAEKRGSTRVPGVKRPVPVYALPGLAARSAS